MTADTLKPFTTLFELPIPEDGLCVALRLPVTADENLSPASSPPGSSDAPPPVPVDELHELEMERMAGMKPARKLSFAGGRVALRRALTALCVDGAVGCPVLPDGVGAPTLPDGTLGSISHTHGLAAAIVCVEPDAELSSTGGITEVAALQTGGSPQRSRAVGIDIESVDRVLTPRLASRCLHESERLTLSKAPSGLDEQMELLLRVSIKEALYKALHPLLRPVTIRWHSVQVLPKRDGSCEVVATDLEEQVGRRMQVAASWRIREGFFVATASAHALPPGAEVVEREVAAVV